MCRYGMGRHSHTHWLSFVDSQVMNLPAPSPRGSSSSESDIEMGEGEFAAGGHANLGLDAMPGNADLVFDCIRVTWVVSRSTTGFPTYTSRVFGFGPLPETLRTRSLILTSPKKVLRRVLVSGSDMAMLMRQSVQDRPFYEAWRMP